MENSINIAAKLGVCVEWLLTGCGEKYPINLNSKSNFLTQEYLSLSKKGQEELIKHLELLKEVYGKKEITIVPL